VALVILHDEEDLMGASHQEREDRKVQATHPPNGGGGWVGDSVTSASSGSSGQAVMLSGPQAAPGHELPPGLAHGGKGAMEWAGDGKAAGDENRVAVAVLIKGGDAAGRGWGLDNRSRRPFYSDACGGNVELAAASVCHNAGIVAGARTRRASCSEQGGSERRQWVWKGGLGVGLVSMCLSETSRQRLSTAAAMCDGGTPSGSCAGLRQAMGGLGARQAVLRYSCHQVAWRQAASSRHRGGAAQRPAALWRSGAGKHAVV
jgi:hypothetical protein